MKNINIKLLRYHVTAMNNYVQDVHSRAYLQAVKLGTDKRAVMLCGYKYNCKPGRK